MKYGPRKPRLVAANRIRSKAVGWKCIAPGCTWRFAGLPGDDEQAKAAFTKHVAEKHPPKSKKPTTRREDVNQAAARIVREATKD